MNIKELLKQHNFSLTGSRIELLRVLSEADGPLSEKEIEALIPVSVNRTTIYRNLNSMSEKGIIQRIISGNSLKYKLINPMLQNEVSHEHIHFQCTSCSRVSCMEDLIIEDYDLPRGYKKNENQFLIIGICRDCNEKR